MKRLALLLLLLLAACSEGTNPQLTPEERLMSEMFVMLNTATAFDEVCNNSVFIDTRNPNLFANVNMIGTMFYAAIYNNRPSKSRADVENQIKYQGLYAVARAKEVMKNKGCQSAEAGKFKQALTMFTTLPPSKIAGYIAGEMQNQGIKPAPKRYD